MLAALSGPARAAAPRGRAPDEVAAGRLPADDAGHARRSDEAFGFALIGDLPYSGADEARLEAMLAEQAEEPLAFVLHVGDVKASGEPCSDALLAHRRALLDRSAHPLLLLPGDNEWVDCRRAAAGGHDPLERLDALRALMWSTPEPLGRDPARARAALRLERQPGLPENVRWRVGPVHCVGLHVVGGGNGQGAVADDRGAFEARERGNRRWLMRALQAALDERADALLIAAHAPPGFGARPAAGRAGFLQDLRTVAAAFPRPILFAHGDGHRFRTDRPLVGADGRPVPHFVRVECFGWPFTSSWVRIAYDPSLPDRFHVGVREPRTPAS
jgi:hypothetical protein